MDTTPSLWMDGSARSAKSGQTFDDFNPIDDSVFATLSRASPQEALAAIESAQRAFRSHRTSTPAQRETWLFAMAEQIEKNADAIIDVLIDEIGSPISKARMEIATAVGTLKAAAGAVRRISGKTLPPSASGKLSMSFREPLGVVAAITPFNVPLIKNVKQSAMAIAAGNAVVMLPSPKAPLIGLQIAKLYQQSGLPDGMFNLLTGMGEELTQTLITDARVQAVSFTGSTRVGRFIGESCGRMGKRMSLEMGGKNPSIILTDANLDKAVSACVKGAFLYQGQICMSGSRIYVMQEIFDNFLDRFVAATQGIEAGDLRSPQTVLGPIIDQAARNRIRDTVNDAVSKGAKICTGGTWRGHVCEPTVLSNTSVSMTIDREETFGPIVSVEPVTSIDEAIDKANATPYGLAASVWTNSLDAAAKISRELDCGMVHINGVIIQEDPMAPFGGEADSGYGRESTDTEIETFTRWKWVTVQTDAAASANHD